MAELITQKTIINNDSNSYEEINKKWVEELCISKCEKDHGYKENYHMDKGTEEWCDRLIRSNTPHHLCDQRKNQLDTINCKSKCPNTYEEIINNMPKEMIKELFIQHVKTSLFCMSQCEKDHGYKENYHMDKDTEEWCDESIRSGQFNNVCNQRKNQLDMINCKSKCPNTYEEIMNYMSEKVVKEEATVLDLI